MARTPWPTRRCWTGRPCRTTRRSRSSWLVPSLDSMCWWTKYNSENHYLLFLQVLLVLAFAKRRRWSCRMCVPSRQQARAHRRQAVPAVTVPDRAAASTANKSSDPSASWTLCPKISRVPYINLVYLFYYLEVFRVRVAYSRSCNRPRPPSFSPTHIPFPTPSLGDSRPYQRYYLPDTCDDSYYEPYSRVCSL